MRFFVLILLAAVFALGPGTVAQDESCPQRESDIAALKAQSKQYQHEYKKAFGKWDEYYQELHSRTYEGTGKPLADSAKECSQGGGEREFFCKGTLKAYDNMSAKEEQAKAELDKAQKAYEDARIKLVQAEKASADACPAE